jgi:hypothetical protein
MLLSDFTASPFNFHLSPFNFHQLLRHITNKHGSYSDGGGRVPSHFQGGRHVLTVAVSRMLLLVQCITPTETTEIYSVHAFLSLVSVSQYFGFGDFSTAARQAQGAVASSSPAFRLASLYKGEVEPPLDEAVQYLFGQTTKNR